MAMIACAGFDSGSQAVEGSYNSGEAGGTYSFDATTRIHAWGYSLRTNPVTTAVGWMGISGLAANGTADNGAASVAISYLTGHIYVPTGGQPASGSEEIATCAYRTGSIVPKCSIRLTSEYKLQLYAADGTTQLGVDSSALTPDTWYRLHWIVPTGASATASLEIYNHTTGVQLGSTVSGTGDLYASNAKDIYFGKRVDRNGQSIDVYFEDWHWSNSAILGAHAQAFGVPDANGSTMDWTGGTNASNYVEVADVPHVAGTYVKSVIDANVPKLALFSFPSCATMGVSGTIHVVKLLTRGAEDTTQTSANLVRLLSGATALDTSTINPGNTTALSRLLHAAVDPATAVAWTTGGIDALEAGCVENNDVAFRLQSCYLAVVFTVSAAANPPTLTSLNVVTGTERGGTAVVATGTDFVDGCTVTVGGAAATGVTFVNSTTVNFTTPAGTVGAQDVVLTNPDTQSDTLTAAFTYTSDDDPVVSLTSPTAGSAIVIPAGVTIALSFTATDTEDGDLTASATTASSNTGDGTGGALGTGSPLNINTTGWTAGLRTITVTATDSDTRVGTASFSITIGTASAATEEDMAVVLQTGVAATIRVPLRNASGALLAANPLAPADVKKSVDGGGAANLTDDANAASWAFVNRFVEIPLGAAEVTGSEITLAIKDQDGPAFQDKTVTIAVVGYDPLATPDSAIDVADAVRTDQTTELGLITTNLDAAVSLTATVAEVNAEVVDALATDTYAEPAQGSPAATLSLAAKLNYLYKAWRNRSTQTATEWALYADDGTTKDQEAAISTDATTFVKGEVGTGA